MVVEKQKTNHQIIKLENKMKKTEALKKGKEILNKINDSGWALDVFWNYQWSIQIYKKGMVLDYDEFENSFSVYMSDCDQHGGTMDEWVVTEDFKCPNEAIRRQKEAFMDYIKYLQKLINDF